RPPTSGGDLKPPKPLRRFLTRQGVTFKLAGKVTGAEKTGSKVKLSVEPAAGGAVENIEADAVLLAIGRVPFTQWRGLDEVAVKRDGKGRVEVGPHFETNVHGIYAIGDVIRGPML